ncbi:MAG: 1-(5-phosphoribosyl)-5-[(5-phosphoribosylamino)methylideneamino]imidazole-4-carboxamide isomerase [Bacteroidetes bacterium]|nr:1-(5-phosphoribosyl)-5-[(5-phosphoribosylamino)methylideneamino]imidazole-4-carboxamide isomerase [Bacteroidota bacterium]
MRIIPAIDIIDGKCVRLSKGDYSTQKTYNENPLEVAMQFEDNGIQYLHLVDLDGAKSKQIVNYKTLELLASKTNLIIDFGGGVKSQKEVLLALSAGANQVTVGSVAAQSPELATEWLKQFGSDKIILGADCKNRKIATNGWLEKSSLDVIDFIQSFEAKQAQYAIVTDIEKDGMLQGPSVSLYRDILRKTSIQLIASGGITTIDDVLLMKEIGCEGVIIGKAIYEGTIKLKELSTLC